MGGWVMAGNGDARGGLRLKEEWVGGVRILVCVG